MGLKTIRGFLLNVVDSVHFLNLILPYLSQYTRGTESVVSQVSMSLKDSRSNQCNCSWEAACPQKYKQYVRTFLFQADLLENF
jgi:hypothetical protein